MQERQEWTQGKPTITITKGRLAKHIATSYGPEFIVPFTAILLSNTGISRLYEDHPNNFAPTFAKEDIDILRAVFYENTKTVVENFLTVKGIMDDNVYHHAYPDIRHLIMLLRELIKYTHGKDAKELDDKKAMRMLEEAVTRQFWGNRTFGRKVEG